MLRGRSEELAAVLGAMRRAARTRAGTMIILTGEPGIGKTALLRAVVEQASRSGSMVGLGHAEEIDQIAPGAPLLLALRSGPRPLIDGSAFAGLASLYDQQLWLVERISGMLEDAARRAPLVIAIDDAHWADRLTRFALRVLPGRLTGSPVTWVLTSRPVPAEVIDEVTAAAEDSLTVTRLALGPLAPADIEDLAEDRLGAPPSEAVRELLRGTGGNPFWAVQVLNGLAWRQAHGLTHDDMHAELIDDVRRRLLPLEPETVSLVRLAAVWGRSLPVEDAARLLGDLPAARVLRAARQAADNGLLTSGEPGVDFAHALVRDAVYADINLAVREALHRACGAICWTTARRRSRPLPISGRSPRAVTRSSTRSCGPPRTAPRQCRIRPQNWHRRLSRCCPRTTPGGSTSGNRSSPCSCACSARERCCQLPGSLPPARQTTALPPVCRYRPAGRYGQLAPATRSSAWLMPRCGSTALRPRSGHS